jgi:hypothetical protein
VANIPDGSVRRVFQVAVPDPPQIPITHNALRWTPDSRALVVNAASPDRPDERDLWIVPIADGGTPRKDRRRGARRAVRCSGHPRRP